MIILHKDRARNSHFITFSSMRPITTGSGKTGYHMATEDSFTMMDLFTRAAFGQGLLSAEKHFSSNKTDLIIKDKFQTTGPMAQEFW